MRSDHHTIHCHITLAAFTKNKQDKPIRLYHKSNWTAINNTITETMASATLNPNTSTTQDIDIHVVKLPGTINATIEEKFPTKILKGNSISLHQPPSVPLGI